jgi:hypothetical protein
MRHFLLSLAILTIPFGALADDWKDESGKGRNHDRREFKEEYWDGNCKVERKMEKNGDYKEERKCKPRRRAQYRDRVEYIEVPPPRYVEVPPPEPVYRDRKPKVQIDLQIRN